MATVPSNLQFSGICRCLVQQGLLSESDAQGHFQEAQKQKLPFVHYLVSNKLVDGKSVANQASMEFGAPFLDLSVVDLTALPIKLVSEKLIREHRALPLFKRGNKLFIAVSDPTDFRAQEEIKFHSSLGVEVILVEDDKLGKAIDTALEAADGKMKDLLDADLENIDVGSGDTSAAMDDGPEIDEAPIVRYVNKVLLDAVKKGASDIHLEPYEKVFRIRFRSDGLLHEYASPPSTISNRIISRIKVMSKMDIAERRVPQDGRIRLNLSKTRYIDFRVNTCPTLFGEKVVLRILDATAAQIGVEKLGFEPIQKQRFMDALKKPYGMILVTGPTGSGKTVSLYTGLNILNDPERNISTAEDPVEITVAGINQVNVNPKAGLTFAEALKAFLRQDPDVIMVGEIRDLETASIAVKAAQTGHLVLSTLHTNDAPQTLNRLLQMGIPAFNIVTAVLLIMAQRLARRLCEHCKKLEQLPPHILVEAGFREDEVDTLQVYGPVGCEHCNKGYKGRVGIYQVMPLSDDMRKLILEGGNTLQLAAQSRAEGINDLRQSGLEKVRQGVTSIEEIDRVTKE